MKRQKVLLIDSAINMVLGLLLITFPPKVIEFLGVPAAGHRFYLSIFGGVLVGVGIALLTEYLRKPDGMVGLGLGGAIAINLCGCVVLAVWLASGKLAIPVRGQIVLWALVVILLVLSGIEILVDRKSRTSQRGAEDK